MERQVKNMIKKFCKKHNLDFDDLQFINDWGTLQLSDYYLNLKDMSFDLVTKQPKKNFFTWYDLALEEKTT